MDPASGLCRGCRRTLDEIARWGEMTEGERARVLAQLSARPIPGAAADPAPAQPGTAEPPR